MLIRLGILDFLKYINSLASPNESQVMLWPWRPPAGFDGQNLVARACLVYSIEASNGYPANLGAAASTLDQRDPVRLRQYNTAASSFAADRPKAAGAICAVTRANGAISNGLAGIMTFSEVEAAQVGSPYVHPVLSGTVTTTAAASYVTVPSATISFWMGLVPHAASILRIESGADFGVYIIRHIDKTNSRLYLQNLDGTQFVASATASLVAVSAGPRMAYFNEASVIPNSVGQVASSGPFNPGVARTSYLYRIRFEKAGSPTPSDASQTGTYWFGITPFYYGDGTQGASAVTDRSNAMLADGRIPMDSAAAPNGFASPCSAGFIGGCPGVAFDATEQKMWFCAADGTNGSIVWWRYKTPEQFREVATSTGSASDPIAGINMAGAYPHGLDIGSDGTVYVALAAGARAGFLAITRALSFTHSLATGLGVNPTCGAVKVDTTRARTGTAGDVSVTVGTGTVDSASGAFTDSDIGRAIKLTGLSTPGDNGTYKISARASATEVTVTTLAGGAVSFAGSTGGTFQIGDRIYLFFNDSTSSPSGTITYMESLAFGTLLTRAMGGGVTNGAQLPAWQTNAVGEAPAVAIDQSNGVVYWASNDTTYQINQYNPTTNTWARRLLSDFNGANGGTGTISNPTVINCIGVNPHASFRELWIGTDNGWVKLDPDTFGGSFSRYYGSGSDATPYSKPAGFARPDGSTTGANANSRAQRWIGFGVDGHVLGRARTPGSAASDLTQYHREGDYWAPANEDGFEVSSLSASGFSSGAAVTPYGEVFLVRPSSRVAANVGRIFPVETQYQWIGSAWVPKEIVRGTLPDALSSPGLSAKDLHTALETLVHGVKVKFTPQGGATPANNEFLGRAGVMGPDRADGATTLGSADFAGSGFILSDVGRYLRIHGGADAGVYRIAVFHTANSVGLSKLNPATAWTATATDSPLTYSVWTMENQGPESATILGAWGIARDNTQDITNIVYEMFIEQTTLSIEAESTKFMVGPVGPPGSAGPVVYFESFARATNPNYSPNTPQGIALPGSPLVKGHQIIDGTVAGLADGTNGRVNTPSDGPWSGLNPAGGTTGIGLSVDLGADVEVASVIVRCRTSDAGVPTMIRTENAGTHGSIFNLHSAPDAGGTPAAASVVRTAGTQLSLPGATTTVTLGTGDFLGTLVDSASDGVTTVSTNRFDSAVGRFPANTVGNALKITSGSDSGTYRIIAVAPDGSYCYVRNLNQTAKTFLAGAGSLPFEIRDAVQDDDILGVPATTHTHRLTVERLLTPTTAQVRCYPATALVSQTWDALKPTWTLQQRASYSVQAQPPDVANNGSYVAQDGRELLETSSWKVIFDLAARTTAQRTARYWKFSGMPRFPAGGGTQAFNTAAFDLYDTAGNKVDACSYQRVDTAITDPNFWAMHVTRADILQSSDAAASEVANVNGVADLGGTDGDTWTLAGTNKFLGFTVRIGANGSAPGGSNVFNNTASDPAFVDSDVGRILCIPAGVNVGFYRIVTASATQVTVTSPAGNPVTFLVDAGPTAYSVHEGINGGTAPDIFAVTTGGVSATNLELTISTVSDDLQTIVVTAPQFTTLASQNWEIRRRCSPSSSGAVDGSIFGRLLYVENAGPRQSGDIVQDTRGYLEFYPADTGSNFVRATGATTIATDTFDGTDFAPDDVGRVLVITTGADKGAYKIATYVSPTQVTVSNLYTGGAVSFNASAGTLTYYVTGERRFRLSRYTTVLRT